MDCIIYKATVKYFRGNIKNQKTIFEIETLFICLFVLSKSTQFKGQLGVTQNRSSITDYLSKD